MLLSMGRRPLRGKHWALQEWTEFSLCQAHDRNEALQAHKHGNMHECDVLPRLNAEGEYAKGPWQAASGWRASMVDPAKHSLA